MKSSTDRSLALITLSRACFGTLILAALLVAGVAVARAAEIIPAIGLTRSVDSDQSKIFGSLAVRGSLAPMVKSEIALAYRTDELNNGDLTVRTWPVTASLWFSPLPTLYAGGGVGWYNTTLDYKNTLPFQDQTTQKFGVHLGGGLTIPLGPLAAMDLNGRYVFMKKEQSQLPPNQFNPDYWSTSLGLAIKF